MEQRKRIAEMEQRFDRARMVVDEMRKALENYSDFRGELQQLSDYYENKEWLHDFEDDEAGRLPNDLKRGVLSEDGLWNLLADNRELIKMMKEIDHL